MVRPRYEGVVTMRKKGYDRQRFRGKELGIPCSGPCESGVFWGRVGKEGGLKGGIPAIFVVGEAWVS